MSKFDQRALRVRFVRQMIATAAVAGAFGLVAPLGANAAELFWSANGTTQGGALAPPATNGWNTTDIHWGTAAAGPFTTAWNNANVDSATFGGTSGGVAIIGGSSSAAGTPITVNVIKTLVATYSIGNGNSANTGNRIAFSGAGAGINAQHASGTTTLNANFTGTLNKTGPGRVELGSGGTANTVKYVTSGGFISMASTARLSATAPAALVQDFITFDGGGLGAGNTAAGDLGNRGVTILAGGAFLGASGAGDLTSLSTGANDNTISAPVVGVGGLTVTAGGPFYAPYAAAGIWRLTNAGNTYQGATTINAGTLIVDGDGKLGNGAGNLNLSGGRFTTSATRSVSTDPIVNPINLTASSVISTISTAGTVNLNFTSNTVGGTAGTLTFRNDAISGTGQFAPRLSGTGFTFARPIVISNGSGTGTTQLSSFNQTGTQTFSGAISGNGSFNRSSGNSTGGTTLFTGNNSYTGSTTVNVGTLTASAAGANQALGGTSGISVNSSGLLLLGNSNQINDVGTMTLNGGIFDTAGLDETLGALSQLSAIGSVIDLGLADSILKFADSSGASWNGTGILNIWNWSGDMTAGGGTDQLYFGTAALGGLTENQLAAIIFYSDNGVTEVGTGGAQFVGSAGEVVPVPEPTSLALLGLGGMSLLARRRR